LTTFSLSDVRTLASILRDAAQAEILPRFRSEILQGIRHKSSHLDLVTDTDEAAEEAIAAALRREFRGSMIVGEEASTRNPLLLDMLSKADLAFVVDPIDGTRISPLACRCLVSWRPRSGAAKSLQESSLTRSRMTGP
jgi:fructose-1,6-bisphosphatase/inositol monophosphatase family enzyme